MRQFRFSIRTTLLLVIGVLTFMVATLTGFGVYRALLNERDARMLKRSSALLNTIYNVEKCLSFERGASVAILYAPPESAGKLFEQVQTNRACEAENIDHVFQQMHSQDADKEFSKELEDVKARLGALERERFALDQAMLKPLHHRPFDLSDDIFTSTTGTISAIQVLITDYSFQLYHYNPTAAQQLHFKYYVWQLTEYAGREYALVGKLIVQDRPPTRDQQIDLVSWRGRIDAGWELSREYAMLGGLDDKLRPLIEDADSKYLKTFDQIRDMFFGPKPVSISRRYPITINTWLKMTADAVDSLQVLKDASLNETQSHIDALESAARRTIYFNLLIFVCATAVGLYSFGVILRRVIRPVNSMANALYGESRIAPKTGTQDRTLDEIGKLSVALDTFRISSAKIEASSRELEERRNYLDTVLSTMMDGLIAIDPHGDIQLVNSAIEIMFGYSRDELIGQNVVILMPSPTDLEPAEYLAPYMVPDVAKRKRETVGRRSDGSRFPIEMAIAQTQTQAGVIYVGTLRDITARQKFEEEREKYLRNLEDSNRELDDFAYIASHDLKEPLRGIHNFSRFLTEDYGERLDDEGRQMLSTLSTLTQQMEGLLNSLLHYSRLGRTDLSIKPTDINEIVDSVMSLNAITIKERNAQVVVTPGLPVVVCDHIRIHEVFQNLVGNALKYNDKAQPRIEIGCILQDHEYRFYVSDNGIGIAEKNLDKIFKIFHRLHPRGAFGGGTGSGLAIAKKIIVQHNGRLWAESAGKDIGTTFYFTIPGIN